MFLTLIPIWLPDYKLTQTGTIEIRNKKKSQLKKVTGFEVHYFIFLPLPKYSFYGFLLPKIIICQEGKLIGFVSS